MMVKASAASTLLFAAGLFLGLAGPWPAEAAGQDDAAANAKTENATSDKPVKQAKKRYSHRKSERVAETKKEKNATEASGGTKSAVPDTVANARAQMNSTDAAPDSAKAMSEAMSAKASTVLLASADKSTEAQAPADDAAVVASDQLNEVDRALQESTATQTVAMASGKAEEQAPAAAAASNDSSTLDKTSLVGKVFIAFGALLTMASAARMFMA